MACGQTKNKPHIGIYKPEHSCEGYFRQLPVVCVMLVLESRGALPRFVTAFPLAEVAEAKVG